MKLKPYAFWRTLCPDEEHWRSAARLVGPMWSFWTAFEHGFDENELKRAQTRTISTKMRSKLTGFDHFEPRFSRGFGIFDPSPTPPFSHQHRVRPGNPVVFDILMGFR